MATDTPTRTGLKVGDFIELTDRDVTGYVLWVRPSWHRGADNVRLQVSPPDMDRDYEGTFLVRPGTFVYSASEGA